MSAASSFGPCVVFTSLLGHVSQSALDDWVHLSFSSATFTCREVESASDTFPYFPAPDTLSDTEQVLHKHLKTILKISGQT